MANLGTYGNVAKAVKDLLNKGYDLETRKIQIKTKTPEGIDVLFDGELQTFGSNAVLGALTFKGANSIASIDKLAVSTHGRFSLESSTSNLIENLKVSLKAEDGIAGNRLPVSGKDAGAYSAVSTVELEYKLPNATVDASVDLVGGPSLVLNALAGRDSLLLGASLGVNTGVDDGTGFAVKDYGGLLGYRVKDFTGVLQTTKKCTEVTISTLHKVNSSTAVASQAVYNRAKKSVDLVVGGSFKVSGETSLQAKVTSAADISASLKQDLGALSVTLATQLNAVTLTNPKFGLNFVLSL